MKRRIFYVVLALFIVFSNLPMTAYAAESVNPSLTILEVTATAPVYSDMDYVSLAQTKPTIKVKLADETEETWTWSQFCDLYDCDYGYCFELTDDYSCPLSEGTAKAEFVLLEDEDVDDEISRTPFEFQVIKNPISSIKATYGKSLIENLDGKYEDVWGEDNEVIGEYFCYAISRTYVTLDVTYTDGTVKSYAPWELEEELGYYVDINDNQWENHFEVGENKLTVEYLGHKTEMVVNVVENPVKSVKVTLNKSLIENVDGCWDDCNFGDYFCYRIPYDYISAEITYKDGAVKSYDYWDVYYETGYWLNVDADQYENRFKLGENKVSVEFMGYKTEMVVNVVENPVKSISFNCGPINELDSTEEWDGICDDEGEWVGEVSYDAYYVPYETSTITINYKDSTRPSDTLFLKDLYETLGYEIDADLNQSAKKPLTVGKHKGTVEFMGVTCEFNFEITKNPVESFTVKATKPLIKYVDWENHGYTGNDFYQFLLHRIEPEVTIKYIDGSTKTYSYQEVSVMDFGNYIIDIECAELAEVNGATVEPGEYTAKVNLAKKTCDLKFKIAEDNIAKLELIPKKDLVENVDGLHRFDDSNMYFCYYVEKLEPVLVVTYKDGSKQEYDYLSLKRYTDIDFKFITNQDENHFKLGENTAKASAFGREIEYKFNIVSAEANKKLKSLEVIPEGVLLENTDGYYSYEYNEETDEETRYFEYDFSKIKYTVKLIYEDGSEKVYNGVSSETDLDNSYFEVWTAQDKNTTLKVGKNKVKALYRNMKTEFEVEVVANPYTAVEISGENELIITFTKADGSKEVHKAARLSRYGSLLYTEDGRWFDINVSSDYDELENKIVYKDFKIDFDIDGKTLESNVLKTNNWIPLANSLAHGLGYGDRDLLASVALYADGYSKQFYGREFTGLPSGPITGASVEDALTMSTCYYTPFDTFTDENGVYCVCNVEDAKMVISGYFDTDRVDVESSPMYDKETGLIKFYVLNTYERGVEAKSLEYKNGYFVYTGVFDSFYTPKEFSLLIRYENGIYYIDSIEIHNEDSHVYDAGVIVKESTCTVKGAKLFTCECGATYTADVDLAPHKDVYVGTKDVHTKCEACGAVTSTTHDYTSKVIKEATATEKGKEKLTCACGYSYEIETEVHTLGDVEISVDNSNSFSGSVSSVVDVKTKLELTANEKALIAAGEKLELVFKLDDIGTKVDTVEKEAIAKVLGEKKLGAFLDISLIKQIGKYEGKVEKLSAPIRVALEVPAELINKDLSVERVYKVLRYHDGDENKVTVLDAKFDKATGILTFETDRFSTYALVYEDVEAGKDDVPDAGVISTSAIWIGAMAVSGLGALVLSKKKKEN